MANLVLAGLVSDSVRLAHAGAIPLALDLVASDLAALGRTLGVLLGLVDRERQDLAPRIVVGDDDSLGLTYAVMHPPCVCVHERDRPDSNRRLPA